MIKSNQIKQALGNIHNGQADYEEACRIFADSFDCQTMTVAAARLADDMAEAFGGANGAASSDTVSDIITMAAVNAKAIRAIASFGAMARELRRLQDIEAEQRREITELKAAKQGAAERESAYRAQRDAEGASKVKAERQLHRIMAELGGLTLSQLPAGAYGGALADAYCDIKAGR